MIYMVITLAVISGAGTVGLVVAALIQGVG